MALRGGVKMTVGHYLLIGNIISTIPDPAARKIAADHFATEFNKRSFAFDPYQWEKKTGGKPAPNSARSN
jgi:hypothetical protein